LVGSPPSSTANSSPPRRAASGDRENPSPEDPHGLRGLDIPGLGSTARRTFTISRGGMDGAPVLWPVPLVARCERTLTTARVGLVESITTRGGFLGAVGRAERPAVRHVVGQSRRQRLLRGGAPGGACSTSVLRTVAEAGTGAASGRVCGCSSGLLLWNRKLWAARTTSWRSWV
jgi:hypothetical protein